MATRIDTSRIGVTRLVRRGNGQISAWERVFRFSIRHLCKGPYHL